MNIYENICADMLALLTKEFELPVTEITKRLPQYELLDQAIAFALLVEREQAVLVYRIVGNDTPYFELTPLIEYIEKNNLGKSVETVTYGRLVRTPENTPQVCLDCGGPFPPEGTCDHDNCAASTKAAIVAMAIALLDLAKEARVIQEKP